MNEPQTIDGEGAEQKSIFAIHACRGLFGVACQLLVIIKMSFTNKKPRMAQQREEERTEEVHFKFWCVLVIMFSLLYPQAHT